MKLHAPKYIARSVGGKALPRVVLVVKNLHANAGDVRDTGLILRSGRSSGGEHENPLQLPCLENPVDRGAWWATVHGVSKSRT